MVAESTGKRHGDWGLLPASRRSQPAGELAGAKKEGVGQGLGIASGLAPTVLAVERPQSGGFLRGTTG